MYEISWAILAIMKKAITRNSLDQITEGFKVNPMLALLGPRLQLEEFFGGFLKALFALSCTEIVFCGLISFGV